MSNVQGEVMRLNRTGEAMEAQEYPATSDELIEAHGEKTIELADGSETFAQVLGRIEATTYDDAEAVQVGIKMACTTQASPTSGSRRPRPGGKGSSCTSSCNPSSSSWT
jgi:hypothetical protein